MPHQDLGQAAEEEEERRRLPSRAWQRGVRLLALRPRGDGAMMVSYYPLHVGRGSRAWGSAPRTSSALATATPAEVTSEQLARALYSNYVGHAHIDYALYGFV